VFGRGLPIRAHNNGEEGGAECHSMPHSSGGASMPCSRNFSVRRRNVSAGKRLAARQLETLCGERRAILAVLTVPPNASMIALAV
jgi:hypothetical protein